MATREDKIAFVYNYLPFALKAQKATNVPAAFSLAQSALESGWSAHKPGNMLFGIKADKSWTGPRQLLTTKDVLSHADPSRVNYPKVYSITPRGDGFYIWLVKDWFRAYNSPAESFADHGRFLTENARYRRAFNYPEDPTAFAREVANAGYAGDPELYYRLLSSLISEIQTIAKGLRDKTLQAPPRSPQQPTAPGSNGNGGSALLFTGIIAALLIKKITRRNRYGTKA